MKKKSYIFITASMLLGLASCSKESPFDNGEETVYGRFATSALRVELQNESGVPDVYNRPTRAGAPDTGNFNIAFIKEGDAEPTITYKYAEMPEIVTLPVGNYTALATYGQNLPAAWEDPYYKGETEFSIQADEITEVYEPIVCRLSNIRVSIAFDSALLAEMADDCAVTVKVGDEGTLDFTRNDTEKSGYFAYVENSITLAAFFHGTVEGYATSETKAYNNVEPGTHYRITFRLHQAGEEDPGDVNTGLTVDASVEIINMNNNIDIDDDVIEDDMRPVEGDKEPDNPGPNQGTPPAITAKAPLSMESDNIVTDGMECEFYVHSETGINNLTVDIDSTTLTAEELEGVGLTSHLDLVNPGQFEEALTGLGFPVNVGGKKDLTFNITDFLPMLSVLGPGAHKFIITVTDDGGTTKKTLTLITK